MKRRKSEIELDTESRNDENSMIKEKMKVFFLVVSGDMHGVDR